MGEITKFLAKNCLIKHQNRKHEEVVLGDAMLFHALVIDFPWPLGFRKKLIFINYKYMCYCSK